MKKVMVFAWTLLLLAVPSYATPRSGKGLAGLDLAGCKLFDMGHPTQPVYPGAVQVTAASSYAEDKGYGWIHSGTVGEVGETLIHRPFKPRQRTLAVGELLTDHVFWRGSDTEPLTFRVDVPDGDYKVAVWTNGMILGSLFWDYTPFKILVGDQLKVQVEAPEGEPWRKTFWREAQDSFEWRPGHNMFRKYIGPAFPVHTFEARARAGRLEVNFSMPRNGMRLDPGQVNRVLPIRGIFIAPANKSQVFEAAVRGLQEEAETRFNATCRMVKLPQEQPAAPMKRFRRQGYVAFQRNLMRRVWPTSVPIPGELSNRINITAAQGRREPACFALRALRDIGGITITITDLRGPADAAIGKDAIEAYWVRYIEQPHSEFHGRQRQEFAYRPKAEILRPIRHDTQVAASKDFTRGFLVAVTPPENAVPGTYSATIHLRPEKAKAARFQLSVTVLPFRLRTYPDDRGRVLYYYGPGRWTRMFPDESLYWDRVEKDLAHCQRYGVELSYQLSWGGDVKKIARFVDLYRKHKWLGPLILGTGNLKTRIIARALARKKGEEIPRAEQYYAAEINWAGDLVRMAKENHWPPIAFYVSAEAAQQGAPEILATKECLETLHAAVPEAKLMEFSINREELDVMATVKDLGMLSPNAACFSEEIIEKCNELGWELWHYGWKRNRFRNGIADWRMGCRGGFAEHYSYTQRAPLNPLDATWPDCSNDSPPFQGPDGPWATLLEERMAAGRTDFLYLATLELTLAETRKIMPNAPAVARVEAWIEALREKIYPHYTYYYRRMRAARRPDVAREITQQQISGYGPKEFYRFRREVAELIGDLLEVKSAQ